MTPRLLMLFAAVVSLSVSACTGRAPAEPAEGEGEGEGEPVVRPPSCAELVPPSEGEGEGEDEEVVCAIAGPLDSDEAIAAFSGCTVLEGGKGGTLAELVIEGPAVTTLAPLSSVVRIHALRLSILNTSLLGLELPALRDLGLSPVVINGNLDLPPCAVLALEVQTGRSNFQASANGPDDGCRCGIVGILPGSVTITGAADVAALAGTVSLIGDLRLSAAVDLSPLSSLRNVCGCLSVQAGSLDGLTSLREVGGPLVALGTATSLAGAPLEQIASLDVRSTELVSLSGLEGIEAIAGDVAILGASSLIDVTGLSQLRTIGGALLVRDNPRLASLDGLEALTAVGVDVQIMSNAELLNVAGLRGLESVPLVSIDLNPALLTIGGPWVIDAGTVLRIGTNTSLADLAGLEELEQLEQVHLALNPSLRSLDGLSGLLSVGILSIDQNDSLEDLAGLSRLESVEALMYIGTNPQLVSLTGLEQLAVTSELDIFQNDLLASLDGLSGLQIVDRWNIFINISLPQCEVDAFFARFPGAAGKSYENNGTELCEP